MHIHPIGQAIAISPVVSLMNWNVVDEPKIEGSGNITATTALGYPHTNTKHSSEVKSTSTHYFTWTSYETSMSPLGARVLSKLQRICS